MKMLRLILLLATGSLLFSACGESQTEASDSQTGSSQREGMMRVDGATIDSMRAADSVAAARGDTAGTQASSPEKMVWLGTLLAPRDGKVYVRAVLISVGDMNLQMNDVIETVNGAAVTTPREVKRQYERVGDGTPVRLTIRRGGAERTLTFARPDSSDVPNLELLETQ